VPAESERLLRRLGARDRLFLGLVAGAMLAGVVAALIFGNGSQSNAGCVVYSHPNFTGGATYRYCGDRAAPFCRHGAAAHGESVIVQCERLGLRVGRARAARDGG
jgi:hypothetical protein